MLNQSKKSMRPVFSMFIAKEKILFAQCVKFSMEIINILHSIRHRQPTTIELYTGTILTNFSRIELVSF